MHRQNIAGLSIKGGRQDNFFFCLLEYFPESKRWFLSSMLQVKDEEGLGGDEAIRSWIGRYGTRDLVVDFPLTSPPCMDCRRQCPGIEKCPVPEVESVRNQMKGILEVDEQRREKDPKAYERERNQYEQFDYSKSVLHKETDHHILSRSFKRRLKKGFLPYWNRPLDFWVWRHFYDPVLDLFNVSYDSFGNTSIMVMSRMAYLRRHFPPELTLYEGNYYITMIELLRAGIIKRQEIDQLDDLELGAQGRLEVIKKIEAACSIFIYEHDLELITQNPRAFDSFMLALAGQALLSHKSQELPEWADPGPSRLIVPRF
jgi:hypothetical protein